ncbi:MAG: single-stranded-DNA-specific exonuclease RecJ [Deltaproteobacteria bacterium]|nr:single-stranded-DNA-specific exonuclease RecJ [Deltaproteobacteria bacterium]
MKLKWNIFHCPAELREELSRQLDIPPLVAQLLIKRAITDPQGGEKFLSPSLNHLYDPFLMKDVDRGVERIIKAIKGQEKILIYGDYDVDGITACALLVDFLSSLGAQPSYYIPHRLEEGYGLNPEAVKKIASQGVRLLICVDCGISDREEIKLAQQLGMDTIVVDHHEVPAQLPPAYAILDPLQPNCPFPFKGLAGVGVAFNLVVALRSRLRDLGFWRDQEEPNLRRYLDFVSLGTIADIVPLMDMNRVLVKYGLKELEDSVRPGLLALKEVSGIGGGEISTGQVAFRLAPRLNAGGRVSNGAKGVKLLLAKEYTQAQKIAEELDCANRERQTIEERTYQEAKEAIMREGFVHRRSLVLNSDGWHPGVIGIVASKLAEEFWRPTVLIALDGEEGKGSARSIVGFHLYEGLKECEEHLLGLGGHKYAAGLKISRDKLRAFSESFERVVKGRLGDEDLIPAIFIDAEVDLKEITPELLSHLSLFPPYGAANPKPLFSTRNRLPVHDVRKVGGNSLKFKIREGGSTYEIIGFNMGYLGPHLPSELRIAFHPQINDWEGLKRLQLELRAMEIDQEG